MFKNNELPIKYHNLGSKDNIHLVVYADAFFANLPDQGSQSGYIIFLANVSKPCIPLNWQSKKIKRIVRSSLSAETLAFGDAFDDALALQAIISQMLYTIIEKKFLFLFILIIARYSTPKIPQQTLQKNNWELILLLLKIQSNVLHAMFIGFQEKNN